jgi:nonspecific dipeptidase
MSSYIDNHKSEYIKTLGEAVAIKSVSCWEETRPETILVVKWFGDKLKKLGATIEIRELGNQVRQKRALKIHTPFIIRGYTCTCIFHGESKLNPPIIYFLQTFESGKVLPLPPALLGTRGNDKSKKTVLIYGHVYVQPAKLVCAYLVSNISLYFIVYS